VNHPFTRPRHRTWLHFAAKVPIQFSNSKTQFQTYVRDLAAPSAEALMNLSPKEGVRRPMTGSAQSGAGVA